MLLSLRSNSQAISFYQVVIVDSYHIMATACIDHYIFVYKLMCFL